MSLRRLLVLLPFAVAATYQGARWWTVTQFYRIDFSVYYHAVDAGGRDLYVYRFERSDLRFNYPPFAAVLLKPLTWLSYENAEYVWFALTLACALAFVWLVTRELSIAPPLVEAASYATLMMAVPVTLTLRLGQINSLVALLVLADALGAARDRRWTGVGTGLATALKVTPGLVIVVLLACRRVREALIASAVFLAAIAASLVAYPHDTWRYWTSILWDSSRVGNVETSFNQRQPDGFAADFSNSLRRPIAWLPGERGVHTALWALVSLVVVLLAIVGARRAFERRQTLLAFTVASVASYLVSPITWAHHLFFAGPALLLAVGDGRSRLRLAIGAAAAAALLDPFEGGEGAYISLARIVLMVAFVAAAAMPRMIPARTRCREIPSAVH